MRLPWFVSERGLTSMQWSVYNEATKRTQYSTVPTSSITAETVTVDGFALSQKDTAGITTIASRQYTASGIIHTQTDGRGNATTTVTDIAGRTTSVTDAAGNQTRVKTSTDIWAISYDAENRPTDFTKVDSSGSTSIHCEYDHMGRRATKTVTVNNNVTLHQRYIHRGHLQIAALDMTRAAHPALWYITWESPRGLGGGLDKLQSMFAPQGRAGNVVPASHPTQPVATRPLAIQKGGTWYTYGWDLTKNICEVYGPAGYIRTAYTYTPYGAVTAAGDVTQPFQWSSEYNDTELGLIYYNYRHYNPVDGRWIGRDIAIMLDNLYNFTANEPIMYFDYIGWARYKTDKKNCILTVRFMWVLTFVGRGWTANNKQEWKNLAKQTFDDYFNSEQYKCTLDVCRQPNECKEYKVQFLLEYVDSIKKQNSIFTFEMMMFYLRFAQIQRLQSLFVNVELWD